MPRDHQSSDEVGQAHLNFVNFVFQKSLDQFHRMSLHGNTICSVQRQIRSNLVLMIINSVNFKAKIFKSRKVIAIFCAFKIPRS